jgi:hypothetical protein
MSDDFQFLVVSEGEYWQRAGRVQRISGIKQEYFHRPDALRIAYVLMQQLGPVFKVADPSFNPYGPTEFRGKNLAGLLGALRLVQDEQAGPLAEAARAIAERAEDAADQEKVLLVLGI